MHPIPLQESPIRGQRYEGFLEVGEHDPVHS
jgi:hypothetical protein